MSKRKKCSCDDPSWCDICGKFVQKGRAYETREVPVRRAFCSKKCLEEYLRPSPGDGIPVYAGPGHTDVIGYVPMKKGER